MLPPGSPPRKELMRILFQSPLEYYLDTVWFTADQHFHHANIIKYCKRPYQTVEEMNNDLIAKWNSVVQKDHVVYSLGDFCLGGWHQFRSIVDQLQGEINLVPGGHDERWLNAARRATHIRVLDPLLTLEFMAPGPNTVVVISHYAMRSWDRIHYGAYHLYGHSHGLLPGIGRSMDAGVDCHNYTPVSLRQVLAMLEECLTIKDHIPGNRKRAE